MKIDMTGKRYNNLTALMPVGVTNKSRNVIWMFVCDCGNKCEFDGYQVRSGRTKSCKICTSERIRLASVKHGMSEAQEFSTWTDIQTRCYNKKSTHYNNYGGRGIKVCDRWLGENGFINFFNDIGKKPTQKHTIERIDVNGDYSQKNCKWATYKEQANNKRNNILITINNKTKTLSEWAEISGLKKSCIFYRYKNGVTGKDLIRKHIKNKINSPGSIMFKGIKDTLKGWSKRTGIKKSTIAMRINKYKWTTERALTTGVKI